jgi:hypothetical protein
MQARFRAAHQEVDVGQLAARLSKRNTVDGATKRNKRPFDHVGVEISRVWQGGTVLKSRRKSIFAILEHL